MSQQLLQQSSNASSKRRRRAPKPKDTEATLQDFQKQFHSEIKDLKTTIASTIANTSGMRDRAREIVKDNKDIRTRQENMMISDKVVEYFQQSLRHANVPAIESEKRVLRYILAADDFASVMNTTRNFLLKHAPTIVPAAAAIIKNFVPASLTGAVDSASKLFLTSVLPQLGPKRQTAVASDGVNQRAIAALLAPEYIQERFPSSTGIQSKCALGHGKFVINLVTNASGNCVLNINVRALASSSYAYLLNDPSLLLTAGTQAVAAPPIMGPFTGSPVIDVGFCVSASVVIQPVIAPINASGTIYFAYYQENTLPTITALANSFIDVTSVQNAPFFQSGQVLREYRQTTVMNSIEDIRMDQSLTVGNNHVMQIIVAGAPLAAQTVARVEISYIVQYTSFASYFPLIQHDYPAAGPATMQLFGQLVSQYDGLSQLNRDKARMLAGNLSSYDVGDFAGVQNVVSQLG